MSSEPPKVTENSEIIFRPLTEGLGFHPFSDGLPYAPLAKNSRSTPKTTSAAPSSSVPSNQFPQPQRPVPSHRPVITPSVKPAAPQPHVSVPVSRSEYDAPIFQESLAASVQEQSVPEVTPFTPSFGYLAKRIFAFLIDSLLSAVLFGVGIAGFVWQLDWNTELLFNGSVLFVSGLFWLILSWIVVTFQEVTFKTTLGKSIFGLVLHGKSLNVLLRAILFLPSAGLFGIGLLWGLFDSRRRCWHDVMTGVQPKEMVRL